MTTEPNWAPDACTLPTAEQPVRIAEFTALFTESLRELDRVSPTRLRLRLDAAARAKAVRLAEAETACCSFFSFTIGEPAGEHVEVDIDVPGPRADVLDALAAQAAAARTRS